MVFNRRAALASLGVGLLLLFILFSTSSFWNTPPDSETKTNSHARLHPPKRRDQVVLVTGSAGFIGYHVSLALLKDTGARKAAVVQEEEEEEAEAAMAVVIVVGLDNFNEYYDVQLKRDRASELVKAGVHMFEGDVCDETLLRYLFERFRFTRVIHLGAQAGVRYSLEAPVNYINNNIQCYLTLLDVLKNDYQNVSLVYASSSTVYGHNSPTPFSPSKESNILSNIYASTKVSNERFSAAYCSLHGLRIVGLRFFTVYGPWGRPDMAVYKITNSIVSDKPVVLYQSDAGPVRRDFTFISDVVDGVLRALDYVPSRCGEVYNLGLGRTRELSDLMKILEKSLDKVAKNVEYHPLPVSDLPVTLADISESREVFGFDPRVDLEEGVEEFVKWFGVYHSQREEGKGAQRNKALEGVLKVNNREIDKFKKKEVNKINMEYQKRLEGLRNKYKIFAESKKETLPIDLTKKKFLHFPGVDSPGSTIIKALGYQGNEELLRKRCQSTEQCIAFTSDGELKNHLRAQKSWVKSPSKGLYVADIDLCLADLNTCGHHEDCVYAGPSRYNCTCHKGYTKLGSGCGEKYMEGGESVSEIEEKLRLSDYMDGLDWQDMVEGKPFVFFQGLDSSVHWQGIGSMDRVVEGGGGSDIQRLEGICRHSHHCLAFNTNGILKYSLSPPPMWRRWTGNKDQGMYVLDVDYCSLYTEQCPTYSSCYKFSPGNYSCRCEPSRIMSAKYECKKPHVKGGEEKGGVSSSPAIHVIVSSDSDHLPGVPHLLHSIASHSSKNLHFHVVLSGMMESDFLRYLQCYPSFPSHVTLDVIRLNPDLLDGLIHVYSSPEEVGNLGSLANFGRFFFHEMFPQLDRALYLDADMVVKGDIEELWRRLCTSDQLLVAISRKTPTYGDVFSTKVKDLFQKRYGVLIEDNEATFNAGVYGVNFKLWREREIHKEVLYWLNQQAREYLWKFGTQPIMLLVGYKQWTKIEPHWNVNGLGWDKNIKDDVIAAAKLLHWNGKGKPWLDGGLYKDIWSLHAPPACSGHGTCEGDSYKCRCQQNYRGNRCQDAIV